MMLMLMLLSLLGKHREACLILACIVDWIGGNNPDGVGKLDCQA